MSVPSAYLGVIIIWSTTPLAILWSSQEVGFMFGVTSRIVIAALLALIFSALLGYGLVWRYHAMLAYLASGLGIFGSMICVYWSSQFIPSGWISVIYGLSPVITVLMVRWWLGGEALSQSRIIGMLLGLGGLLMIFGSSFSLQGQASLGVLGVLVSVTIHSASAVWIKRINAGLPAIVMTCGGLLVASPLFILSWLISDAQLPASFSSRSLGAIGYLALFGSVLGFSLYYYVLNHVEATRVALLTLITPLCALLLGNVFNQEPLTFNILAGSLLIISGLAMFEFGSQMLKVRIYLLRSR